MPSSFTLDPREVDGYLAGLPPRRELVYRLAIRGLCSRCRDNRRFEGRTEELMQRFAAELREALAESALLEWELMVK